MEDVILTISDRAAFRAWLSAHPDGPACRIRVKRGRPLDDGDLYYLDAVEEALCFGWIDSIYKTVNGITLQRFSPRQKYSPWSELNKERARRLEKLGLMTERGRSVLPKMGPRSFRIDPEIEAALKKARVWTAFRKFHPLYQRVRAYNIAFFKKRDPSVYEQALNHLITETRKGRMFGEWNDYGRLLDY